VPYGRHSQADVATGREGRRDGGRRGEGGTRKVEKRQCGREYDGGSIIRRKRVRRSNGSIGLMQMVCFETGSRGFCSVFNLKPELGPTNSLEERRD